MNMKKKLLYGFIAVCLGFLPGCFSDETKENEVSNIVVRDGLVAQTIGTNSIISTQNEFVSVQISLSSLVDEDNITISDDYLYVIEKTSNTTNIFISAIGETQDSISFSLSDTDNITLSLIQSITQENLDSMSTSVRSTNPILLGDYNGDSIVNLIDFSIFKQNFGSNSSIYDIAPASKGTDAWSNIYCYLSGDNTVGLEDLTVFAANYGYSSPESTTIPVTSINLTATSTEFDISSTTTITAAVSPDNATDQSLNWTVGDNSILEIVSTTDNSAIIYGLKAGTTSVTATSTNGTTSNLSITVNAVVHTGDTNITLNTNSITVDGSGVDIDGTLATIVSAGTYNITGTLTDGQILVDTDDEDDVTLVLNGVNITNSISSPLFIKSAENTIIVLADSSQNYLTDPSTYVYEDAEDDEPDAALFSKDDLVIQGNGTLTVHGNYNQAIKGKDSLIINSGNLNIYSVDDGIQGKDFIAVYGGNINIEVDGDGFKSTNDEDEGMGYIFFQNGTFNIVAGADGIQAETNLTIEGGTFDIVAGGGSNCYISDDDSAKAFKADGSITINGGTFDLNVAEDAINCNDEVFINGGTFTISAADDGIHSDNTLTINDGIINVIKSYEGIESSIITINGGELSLTASDDGLNVAGGTDGSGETNPWGPPDDFNNSSNNFFYMNDGYIYINSYGDGVDVNGAVVMQGGTIIVSGPTNDGNGALDYDSSFAMNGGILVAAGSAGMAQAPSTSSTQCCVLVNFNNTFQANTLFNIKNTDGTNIVTFAPEKNYQSVLVSTPLLYKNNSYTISYNGSSTGTCTNGIYENGTYTNGTTYSEFTTSNIITTLGNTHMR